MRGSSSFCESTTDYERRQSEWDLQRIGRHRLDRGIDSLVNRMSCFESLLVTQSRSKTADDTRNEPKPTNRFPVSLGLEARWEILFFDYFPVEMTEKCCENIFPIGPDLCIYGKVWSNISCSLKKLKVMVFSLANKSLFFHFFLATGGDLA